MPGQTKGRFTGWHMTGILVGFFGVVVGVNILMASFASTTFGGIVVENSYVASQEYNRWLEQAEEQEKLGWDAATAWRPDGRLAVKVTGAPDDVAVNAIARHPLGRMPDVPLAFEPIGQGRYLADRALPDGRWTLRLELSDGTNDWRREEALQ
ncbi:nitrogen fixation protein FixH [Altererythrobacter atlanticus]|uniref:FixH n=1 Tax=Croceibacterium atlanticum TaxID=1267766 RepID=A0A0F7KTP8_9SPHN|nr:FixH family protein [Croceibacterium atlanticum]AKH43783.1 FixH [Croceibacterium atlanticum]MBB5733768.1 nitrogen fixation protein FixH [Croceibacterium atlanticum]